MQQAHLPRSEYFAGIMIGVPTFGMVSDNFMASMVMISPPIFHTMGYYSVRGKPVDVARNEIVVHALKHNFRYLLFRDDDVLPPLDETASRTAMKRLVFHLKDNFENCAVVGGVVYAKETPPTPMILKKEHPGGFEDWNVGDVFECDAIGMGFTMVNTEVFSKIPVKEWVCPSDTCPSRWYVYRTEAGECPDCKRELLPVFFKTLTELMENGTPGGMTEDVYFCQKVIEAGYKVWVDTGVQCVHEDFPNKTIYYYNQALKAPVWQIGDLVHWITKPGVGEVMHSFKEVESEEKQYKKWDLGAGRKLEGKDGWIGVDLFSDGDESCDLHDLTKIVQKHGQAEEIRSSHVLEHFSFREAPGIIREWVKALKPGGKITTIVPDLEWCMKNWLDLPEDHPEKYGFELAKVFGFQPFDQTGAIHEGHIHKGGFNRDFLDKIFKSIPSIESYEITHNIDTFSEEGKNQAEYTVVAYKKKLLTESEDEKPVLRVAGGTAAA